MIGAHSGGRPCGHSNDDFEMSWIALCLGLILERWLRRVGEIMHRVIDLTYSSLLAQSRADRPHWTGVTGHPPRVAFSPSGLIPCFIVLYGCVEEVVDPASEFEGSS